MTILRRLLIALGLPICGLALMFGVFAKGSPAMATTEAQELQRASAGHCAFASITVTADLGQTPAVSDTFPSGAISRTVYFANVNSGVITLTSTLTDVQGVQSCYLWSSPAFGHATGYSRTLPVTVTNPMTVLTYPVSITDVSAAIVLTSSHVLTDPMHAGLCHETVLTFTQDITAPHPATVTINGGALYATVPTVTLTLSADDAGSGVAAMQFSNDEVTWNGWQTYVPSVTWSLADEDGPRTVYARFRDYVSNIGIYTETIFLDRAEPIVKVIAPRQVATTTFPVGWEVSDPSPSSGLSEAYDVAYREDEGDWQTWLASTPITATDFVSATLGHTYTFSVTARDRAGNAGFGQHTVLVDDFRTYLPLILRPPPRPTGSVSVAGGAATVYQQSVTLTLNASVSGDTVTGMRFRNDGTDWSRCEDFATSKTGWLLADGGSGLRTVYAQFIGSKGGISDPVFDEIYLARNGDFENGWADWEHGGELAQTIVADPTRAHHGNKVALLGNAGYNNLGGVPVGNGHIWHTFGVPDTGTPRLTIWYRIYTHDRIWGDSTNKYWDSFEIYINNVNWQQANDPDPNDPLRRRLCRNNPGKPDTSRAGLVLCDGNPGDETGIEPPLDLGWRSVTLDLTLLKGQDINLYLANFNRHDGWYNTWTYVDHIRMDW